MADNTWLENLKVGDKVIVKGGPGTDKIATVDRLTPTLIIVGNKRFRKKDGNEAGGDTWWSRWLKEATPHAVEELKSIAQRQNLLKRFKEIDPHSLTDWQLQQIIEITEQEVS